MRIMFDHEEGCESPPWVAFWRSSWASAPAGPVGAGGRPDWARAVAGSSQLLTSTTPWVRLLAAPRSPGVPRILILIVGMAHRYVSLLLASEEPTL